MNTYSSVPLHPEINEPAESTNPLEETWGQSRKAKKGNKNQGNTLGSVCIFSPPKIKITCVQTFSPYEIRNLVSLKLSERIYVSSSCFWLDFLLWLNPQLMHASSEQFLCLAFQNLTPGHSLVDINIHRGWKDYITPSLTSNLKFKQVIGIPITSLAIFLHPPLGDFSALSLPFGLQLPTV